MHRHLIAGAFACFGSSLFGQVTINPANQDQGALNNIQSTLQNGTQKAQDTVDRNLQQSSGASVSGDVQNRSSLSTQSQVNGASGPTGNVGIQSNTNLQNNSNRQPGQLNSNLSTQVQGQPAQGTRQRGGIVTQDQFNQYGNSFQANGINGAQSFQTQGQPLQVGQPQNQGWNAGAGQNGGPMQYRTQSESGNSMAVENNQQPWQSQSASRVYVLRIDASGREFICVNGRPVYFDNVNSVSAQANSGTQNQYRAGYGNYDLRNGQNTQNQSSKADQLKTEQKTSGSGQNSFSDGTNSQTLNPANSTKTTNGSDVVSPDRDRLGSDKQIQAKQSQNEVKTNTDFDVKSDTINPSKTSNDLIEPK